VPTLNKIEQWETRKNLDMQVFSLVMDGNLTFTEVQSMTHAQRRMWLNFLTERAERQKQEMENSKSKK
jgi:hypothetical protein